MTRRPHHHAPDAKTNFNVGIQLMRGIAALLVVFHHSLEESRAAAPHLASDAFIRFGACGVDIFFVISGFIIYNVTYGRSQTNPERPGTFLLKRFLRIFPLYWICLALTLALWGSGHFFRSAHVDLPVFLSAVFLLPFRVQLFDVAWTLVYEMYFYYVFAATLALRNARLSVAVTVGVIASVIGLAQLLPPGTFRAEMSNPIALEFAFGLVLSHFVKSPLLRGKWIRYMWLPALVLFAIASTVAPSSGTAELQNGVRFWAWGVPALLIVASFIATPFGENLLTRLFLVLGNASYSVYLTHPFVMIALAFLLKGRLAASGVAAAWGLAMTAVAASLALGLLAHYWIERPVLARLRRRFELSPPMP